MDSFRRSGSLKKLAISLREYVIKFYGKKYAYIVDEVLKNANIYKTDDDHILDLYSYLLDTDDISKSEDFLLNCSGLYLEGYNGDYFKRYVIIKDADEKDVLEKRLFHELYGHHMCSIVNHDVNMGFISLNRNGIAFNNDFMGYNNMANEGFIELFAQYMYKLKYADKECLESQYKDMVDFVRPIYEREPKKIKTLMVEGKGNICKIYDKNNLDRWAKDTEALEKKLSKKYGFGSEYNE